MPESIAFNFAMAGQPRPLVFGLELHVGAVPFVQSQEVLDAEVPLFGLIKDRPRFSFPNSTEEQKLHS